MFRCSHSLVPKWWKKTTVVISVLCVLCKVNIVKVRFTSKPYIYIYIQDTIGR